MSHLETTAKRVFDHLQRKKPIKLSTKVSEFWRILFGMIYCWFWKGKKKSPFFPKSSELLIRLIKQREQNCMQTCDSWYLYICPFGVLGRQLDVCSTLDEFSDLFSWCLNVTQWNGSRCQISAFFTSQDFTPKLLASSIGDSMPPDVDFFRTLQGEIQQTDDASLVVYPLENERMSPENHWLEDVFPIWNSPFLGTC